MWWWMTWSHRLWINSQNMWGRTSLTQISLLGKELKKLSKLGPFCESHVNRSNCTCPRNEPRLGKWGYQKEKKSFGLSCHFVTMDGFKTSNHRPDLRSLNGLRSLCGFVKEPVKKESNQRFNSRLFDFSSPSEDWGYASETGFLWLAENGSHEY